MPVGPSSKVGGGGGCRRMHGKAPNPAPPLYLDHLKSCSSPSSSSWPIFPVTSYSSRCCQGLVMIITISFTYFYWMSCHRRLNSAAGSLTPPPPFNVSCARLLQLLPSPQLLPSARQLLQQRPARLALQAQAIAARRQKRGQRRRILLLILQRSCPAVVMMATTVQVKTAAAEEENETQMMKAMIAAAARNRLLSKINFYTPQSNYIPGLQQLLLHGLL